METRTLKFPVARVFFYLNKNGKVVSEATATKNETIEACKPVANEREDVIKVLLLDLSTGNKVDEYVKFNN